MTQLLIPNSAYLIMCYLMKFTKLCLILRLDEMSLRSRLRASLRVTITAMISYTTRLVYGNSPEI